MGVDALLALSQDFRAKHRACRPPDMPDCWGRWDRFKTHNRECGTCTDTTRCQRVTRGEE